MSVAELKEKIIAKVSETNDESVLEDYWSIISNDEKPDRQIATIGYEMDEEEIAELARRDAEVERGEYYTHEEFMQIMHEELSRYKNKHG